MAVTVRTTKTTINNVNGTSFTIDKPTGLAVGDILVAIIRFGHGSAGTIATPSGWTAPQAQKNFATDSASAKAFVKIADSADVASSNFTFTSDTSSVRAGVLMAFSNVGTTDVSNSNTASDGSASCTTITPVNRDFFVIGVASKGSGSCSGVSVASYAMATNNPTWTELADISENVGGGNGFGVATAYASRAETTATGNITATVTPANETVSGCAIFAIALSEIVVISPTVINITSTAQTPTISGGASVSAPVANATGATITPNSAGQADWSSQNKTEDVTFIPQPKS